MPLVTHQDLVFFGRVGLAFVLSYAVGFERALRGAPAGDRTFALVGTAAAAVSAVTVGPAPQAIGGVVTGVGFIGAGLVLRGDHGTIRGVTSAAAIFAATGVRDRGRHRPRWLALFVAILIVVDLELRFTPVLNRLDAHRYAKHMTDEPDDDSPDGPPG